jgi:hypothetical protein
MCLRLSTQMHLNTGDCQQYVWPDCRSMYVLALKDRQQPMCPRPTCMLMMLGALDQLP